MRDYYEILQVHPRAIPEIIEKAYRVLVRKYHPDVHPSEKREWAERRMTELNVAYSALSVPAKRDEYDRQRVPRGEAVRVRASDDTLGDEVEEITFKCFNHPLRSFVTFCFHCGRPICNECLVEGEAHPRCTTCLYSQEQEAVDEPEMQPPEPGMGVAGVMVFYGLWAAVGGVMLGAAVWLSTLIDDRTIRTGFVAGVVLLAAAYALREFGWHIHCPRCATRSGRVQLRAATPWRWLLHPREVCPVCSRPFGQPTADYRVD